MSSRIAVRVLHSARHEQRWNYPSLAAPYWRFYWNRSGCAWVTTGGTRVAIEPHRGYLIPPDTPFSSHSDGPIDHFYVHFTVSGLSVEVRPGVYALERSDRLAALLEPLPSDRTHCAGLVLIALAQLPDSATDPVSDDPVVRSAIDFIERNLDRSITAAELARAAGIGERTLRRRFNDAMNQTPAAFSTLRRIEHACILLHFSEFSVDEIAARTGFCDRYHLSRVFRRLRGMGPAAFKRVALETNPPIPDRADSAQPFP
ncbi:MAG TPA: AraC family transcriptional regulator [Spirochaetia bacterium]|nr:AraC family transcriptional regulator [Spirochaetia bacterium]